MLLKSYKSYLATILLIFLVACGTSPNKVPLSGLNLPSSLPDMSKDISAGQEDISVTAIGLIGIPYRWGGNTPAGGFDCSGLIGYVFSSTRDKKIPRVTTDIARVGEPVINASLAPGDLVFFNTMGTPNSHVGIYVGKGRFVHAPSTGGTVRLEYLSKSYWASRFTQARRLAAQ